MPSYTKLQPDSSLGDATAVVVTPVYSAVSTDHKPVELIGYQLPSAAPFTVTCELSMPLVQRGGTIAVEIIYKNAIGTVTLQQSVSGTNFSTIVVGSTTAMVTLADSSTVQVQTINLAVGAYAGNFLRAVWDATSAGTGYITINIV